MARRSGDGASELQQEIEPLTNLPFVREQCPRLWNTPAPRGHIAGFGAGDGWADDFIEYLDQNLCSRWVESTVFDYSTNAGGAMLRIERSRWAL